MRSSALSSLLRSLGFGLALMLLGVIGVTHADPDSGMLFLGLFSHLVGLLCLANALRHWLFSIPNAQTQAQLPVQQAPRRSSGLRFSRLLLSLILLIAPGYALWNAGA